MQRPLVRPIGGQVGGADQISNNVYRQLIYFTPRATQVFNISLTVSTDGGATSGTGTCQLDIYPPQVAPFQFSGLQNVLKIASQQYVDIGTRVVTCAFNIGPIVTNGGVFLSLTTPTGATIISKPQCAGTISGTEYINEPAIGIPTPSGY